MVLGIGCDIIEIKRVQKAVSKDSFFNKYFTEKERELLKAKAPQSCAGNFAAKEAAAKALGTGFSGFMPIDIEILRDESGKPVVNLHGGALDKAAQLNITKVLVSISHSGDYAVAYAIALCE